MVRSARFHRRGRQPAARHTEKLQLLLDRLVITLPGSYGMVYERDDEQPSPGAANAFKVRVLARGSVTELADPFFSPIVPTIED